MLPAKPEKVAAKETTARIKHLCGRVKMVCGTEVVCAVVGDCSLGCSSDAIDAVASISLSSMLLTYVL